MSLYSIQQRLLARRNGRRRATQESGWVTTIDQVIRELETLNRSTERDFLAVGKKLGEFRSAARHIGSDMTAVIELIAGEQGRHASQALARMLEHSREMDTAIEQSALALSEVSGHSVTIRHAFSGLGQTVSVFRTLCTLTRIETSRLGGADSGLGHLTAEVGPLTQSIHASGQSILDASSQLEQDVQSAARSGAALREAQLKELPALITGVLETLARLEAQQVRARDSAARQATQYTAVHAAIDDLVGSIQFHDITRQQVEHVVQALQPLRSAGADGRSNGILTLQSSHLNDAARTFAASADRMQHDLAAIAERIEQAPEQSRALAGISDDNHDSFFIKMEDQCSAILQTLDACIAAQVGMESTAARLSEAIDRMRKSVTEIQAIEIRIQHISINATIRAAHIGADGVALNVIAEIMQRLALESNTNTETAAGALAAMSAATSRIGRGELPTVPESSTERLIEEMRSTVAELHSSGQSSLDRVKEIAALGERLAGDIGAVRDGFTAGGLFAEVVDQARTRLEGIAAQTGPAPLQPTGSASTQSMDLLATHYTMQRERDVHASVVTGKAMPVVVTGGASGAVLEDDDLGSNVDLF